MIYFNSHAHVERDEPSEIVLIYSSYFNSHAHVERDYAQTFVRDMVTISTHTLTWSVTGMSLAKTADDLTFQLTRSRGA